MLVVGKPGAFHSSLDSTGSSVAFGSGISVSSLSPTSGTRGRLPLVGVVTFCRRASPTHLRSYRSGNRFLSRQREGDDVVTDPFEIRNEVGRENDADTVLGDDRHEVLKELTTRRGSRLATGSSKTSSSGRFSIASVRAS